jgi:hypothetical protein
MDFHCIVTHTFLHNNILLVFMDPPCLLQVVGRPGGGGESDAAFTPSPPVVAPDTSPCVATLTLAHQTRIRTLYSGAGDGSSPPTENGVPGQVVPPLHHGMCP